MAVYCFNTVFVFTLSFFFQPSEQTLTLIVPTAGNCEDTVTLKCTVSSGESISPSRIWYLNGKPVFNSLLTNDNQEKYMETLNNHDIELSIKLFSLEDAGNYSCQNGFTISAALYVPFECKAKTAVVLVNSKKILTVIIRKIYPSAADINFSVTINSQTSTIIGNISSTTENSQESAMRDITWVSSIPVTVDGQYSYTIIVTTLTNADPIIGDFIIAAPSTPVISNTVTVNRRTVVRATQDQAIVLRCTSSGGYPQTYLRWYKGTSIIIPTSTSAYQETDKTYTVTNEYSFQPSREDDRTVYQCQSYYPVAGDVPKNSTAELYLYLKPSISRIPNPGTVAAGSVVNVECEASQARPAAAISWNYRGKTISPTVTPVMNNVTETFTTISTFTRQLQRNDNGQKLQCIVSHQTFQLQTATATMSVQFPPLTLSLNGNMQINANGQNTLTLTCTTDTANPYATVSWKNGNTDITSGVNQSDSGGAYGGRTTEGRLQLRPTRDMDSDVIWCSAENALNTNSPVKNSTILDLLYSPRVNMPEPSTIIVNETSRNVAFHCYVISKPRSTISWYHNSDRLNFGITEMGNNSSLTITSVDRTHYGNYKCRASNKIAPIDEVSARLVVQFHPIAVHITGNHKIEANGINELYLICKTESCYPAASIKWKNGSDELPNSSQVTGVPGLYGGSNYSQTLVLTPTRYMDGNTIICKGSNSQSDSQPVSESVILDLKYHPITAVDEAPIKTVTEGQPDVSFTCKANSKPAAFFKWYKGTSTTPVKSGTGSLNNNMLMLTIKTVEKIDAGIYNCTADNGVGTADNSNGKVHLIVQYPPVITITASNVTENDTGAEIVCGANGVPADYTFLDWKQTWLETEDIIRQRISTVVLGPAHRQALSLTNLSYQDTGLYSCGASNNISRWGTTNKEMRKSIYLLVKSRPVITKPSSSKEDPHLVPAILKQPFTVNVSFYSNVPYSEPMVYKVSNGSSDGSFNLTHIADVTLQTKDDSVDLQVHGKVVNTGGYTLSLTHTLTTEEQFGTYTLKIPNEIGHEDFVFKITPQGPPCTPVEPAIDSYKVKDITVSWIRCFHGGYEQTFVIQYSIDNNIWFNGTTKYGGLITSTERINTTIENLSPATQYYIRLFSYSIKGSSDFTDVLNVTTKEELVKKDKQTLNIGVVAGGAVGGIVAAAAVTVLVIMFVRRRSLLAKRPRKKLLKEKERSNGAPNCNDDLPEINLNPMYESAGPSNSGDVYSQVNKTNKNTQLGGDIYSQVNKPSKPAKKDDIKDIYAEVKKPKKKETSAGKAKKLKKEKAGKKPKQEKTADATVYDNVEPVTSTSIEDANVYENPSCTTEDEVPKQRRNPDEIVYVELDLPKQKASRKDKKPIIHGIDERTDYAVIRYGEVGAPAPESDEEAKKEAE